MRVKKVAPIYELIDKSEKVVEEYFQLCQRKTENEHMENQAAIKIQTLNRCVQQKVRYVQILHAVHQIQRYVKGYFSRKKVIIVRMTKENNRNLDFYHYCASTIQRFFRGYWSRLHAHDFYERKRYLTKVKQEGERTVEWLNNMRKEKIEQKNREDQESAKAQIGDICSGLHHLLSTQQIPGIYNSPYVEVVPTAFGVPIEQALKDCQKLDHPHTLKRPARRLKPKTLVDKKDVRKQIEHQMRYQNEQGFYCRKAENAHSDIPDSGVLIDGERPIGVRQPLLSRTANVGRLSLVQGPFRDKETLETINAHCHNQFQTVQAMNEYELCQKIVRQETRLNKLTRIAPDDFLCKKPTKPKIIPSVHADTLYRGKPIEFREDYWQLPKIKEKPPFFTAVNGGHNFTDYDTMGPQI